jgi:DNA polymerase I-like protein with 3'-5' exonuclease and polymerase domains
MKILFLGTEEDKKFLYYLKGKADTFSLHRFEYISEIVGQFAKSGVTHIITTQPQLIPLLCKTASPKDQTLDKYAGSVATHEESGMKFLFIHPLFHCVAVSYGKFLLDRFISKFTKPNNWLVTDKFSYGMIDTTAQFHEVLDVINKAILTAIDIETGSGLWITSISYTAVLVVNGRLITRTYVIAIPKSLSGSELDRIFYWIEQLNATHCPKVMQNGKYDVAYTNRYGVPIYGYLLDTANMHCSWYSELPKDLGTLATFYIRESIFWKNEGDADLYYYNALDTWHTAWVALAWLAESPEWAKKNYELLWNNTAPNILMEATGLAVDADQFYKIKDQHQQLKLQAISEIRQSFGTIYYNPGSPDQNKRMLRILGCDKVKSADAKYMKRVMHKHPFLELMLDLVLRYKKEEKMIGTYLNELKHYRGRILYSLSAYTVTSRNMSKSHHFWCGFNIQNIPRTGGIKSYIIADPGFVLGEADYAQAESRDTGYITGDTTLISNVDNPDRDFHRANASMFFGVEYDEVDAELRQLSKPVNHGATYLMAEETLIDSMGLDNVYRAASRLRLASVLSAKQVCKYLLNCFARTYPVAAHDYPAYIKDQVKNFNKLINPYGLTRWCFGDPNKNASDLRALVAHLPQSTNAQALGIATALVYERVWKPNKDNFKMCAQIHDSILFQVRIGHEYLADEVKHWMEVASTVEVTDIKGIKRELKVPVDIKVGGTRWKG